MNSNVKSIRKDRQIDRKLKKHFKEDLHFSKLAREMYSDSSAQAQGFIADQENMPLLTEQAEGGSKDFDQLKQIQEVPNDEKRVKASNQKPHFSSEHSELDDENEKEGGGRKYGEYIETSKCCYCIPLKCALIIFSVLVILDFIFECWDTYELLDNTTFDSWYGDVYCGLMVFYFIGIILIFYYWCATDSPSTRQVLPWAFLIASVINFLIAIWLVTYIFGLYKKEWVYVQRWTSNSNLGDEDKALQGKYKRVSKVEYVLEHLISPVIDGICFMFIYCSASGWEDRHKNQEKAHG